MQVQGLKYSRIKTVRNHYGYSSMGSGVSGSGGRKHNGARTGIIPEGILSLYREPAGLSAIPEGNREHGMENAKHISCRECDRASQCFQHLYPDELEFINSRKIRLTYLPDENLFKQGAFSPYIMYIVEGLAKVFLQTGRHRQVNIRLAGTGEFLAFHSLFGRNVYACSATALKESIVCLIEKKGLLHLLQKNSDFALSMISKNCRNENQLLGMVENITSRQMRGKLAAALTYLHSYEEKAQPVFPYLTRQDIADFACISHESAIRYLKEFEKEGLVRVQGRDIQITDRERLELIGEKG